MNKIIFFTFLVFSSLSYALEDDASSFADCIVLKDEDSIICKYIHERVENDLNISVQWIEPTGLSTRQRTLLIPAGHASVYDYRFVKDRAKGTWTFKVIDNSEEFTTTFVIE